MALQLSKSDQEFVSPSQLWKKKWEGLEGSFVDYFWVEYIDRFNGWHEGHALLAPSTNNCLEATNNVIKKSGTLREKLPLGHFFEVAKRIVEEWSVERNPALINKKLFANIPSISLKLMTEAYNWSQSMKPPRRGAEQKIKIRQRGNLRCFFITPSGVPTIREGDIDKFERQLKNMNWHKFDTFKKYQSGIWLVTMSDEDWMHATCTCPTYCKHYTCKDTVGIAISKGYIQVPDEALTIPIGHKRKRGRPSKATKALLK